jgi:hypothetical protein
LLFGIWSLELFRSVRHREIHIPRIVQDSPAIAACNQLFGRLAGDQQLRLELHVTATTDSMLNADDDMFPFAPHHTLVPSSRLVADRRG